MKNRNQSLDALRGVAVLMVIISHYYLAEGSHSVFGMTLGRGVDLFFVLSGFLISGLLFSEYKATGKIQVKRFWLRRALKIWPPFYAFLLLAALTWLIVFKEFPQQILSDVFFVQNYAPHMFVHTWSVAVEEHFYFALPSLLLLFIWWGKGKRDPFRVIPLLSILASVLCLWGRASAFSRLHDWDTVAYPTHLRVDALLAGVTLGYFAHFQSQSFQEAGRRWVLALGVAFSAVLLLLPMVLQLMFAYVAFSFVVAWVANQKPSSSKFFHPVAWIGYYSYSIYLWHPIGMLSLGHLPLRWFRFPLYAIIAIGPGVVMSKLIEIPFLRIRDKFWPSRNSDKSPMGTSEPLCRPLVQQIRGGDRTPATASQVEIA